MATKIAALVIMAVFYTAYLGKKYSQRRQGITTNQIGKGDKPRKVLLIENIMGWATFAVIPIEIISISRNPAFVGFDLMYIGLLMAFPNIIHLLFAVFPAVMLHLQIRQEEDFLRKTFGTEYDEYCKRVRRYL